MTFLPLLAVGILMKFVAVLFVMVCVVLILVILIQKGRGGGLSGAFGGGMASGLLGSKTGDFLTWVTIGLVAVFLGLAVLMARYYRPSVSEIRRRSPRLRRASRPRRRPSSSPRRRPRRAAACPGDPGPAASRSPRQPAQPMPARSSRARRAPAGSEPAQPRPAGRELRAGCR